MYKFFISVFFLSIQPLMADEVCYTPSHFLFSEKERAQPKLEEGNKFYSKKIPETGIAYGSCARKLLIEAPEKARSISGVYLYYKGTHLPFELRTFATVTPKLSPQIQISDNQGFALTGRLRPYKKAPPIDMDIQFNSNNIFDSTKMGVETSLKFKY
ncbi:MAG: hypothetical protein WDZ28_03890 [Simkaniaceae bacterium]